MSLLRKASHVGVLALAVSLLGVTPSASAIASGQIVVGVNATALERYAGQELQRYLYQLTGTYLPVVSDAAAINTASYFVGQRTTNTKINDSVNTGQFTVGPADPGAQGYVLKNFTFNAQPVIAIAGSDKEGVLYGVYGLLQDYYGIGFNLDGDTMPATKTTLNIVSVNEKKAPKQAIRGVLPWTNFLQSSTVYSYEDYKFVIDQMAKSRMNLLNIHNYNGFYGHQELANCWNAAIRCWNASTKSGHAWGMPGWSINQYQFGAGDLYDDYDFSTDATLHNEGLTNQQIADKGTRLFQRVIAYAHTRGVKIALGVEPSNNPAEGQFLVNNYPTLDYLVQYVDESGNSGFNRALYDTTKATGMKQAISGWGLSGDLASLPADVIAAPIAPYIAGAVSGAQYKRPDGSPREYWGTPWMERDGDSSVQGEWASSENFYPYAINLSETISAYNQLAPNTTGWQTLTWRIGDAISPKLAWMARAPWDYTTTNKNSWGYVGGTATSFPQAVSPNFGLPTAIRSVRYGNMNYRIDVPASETYGINSYRVTLTFAEMHFNAAGARRFNVDINGVRKLTNYDVFAAAGGANRGVQVTFTGIQVPLSLLDIKFTNVTDNAMVSTIDVVQENLSQSHRTAFSAGGPASDGIAGDQPYGDLSYNAYREFAAKAYGPAAADAIATIINQNEPLGIGGGEAEATRPLGANSNAAANIAKADDQLATINFWMNQTSDAGYRERLRLLAMRINSTKAYNLITPTDRADLKVWDFSDSFRNRVNDISTLGMLASFENRYVQSYFTANPDRPRVAVGQPDTLAPRVIVISPPTSLPVTHGVDIQARILDDRVYAGVSASLFYRQTGTTAWSSTPMVRRTKAIFGVRLPGGALTSAGLEYYVQASDGANTGVWPMTGATLPASIVGEAVADVSAPSAPGNVSSTNKFVSWTPATGDVHEYRIYRSTSPSFSPSKANYLTYVANTTTGFHDLANDYGDAPKNGTYYYMVTAIDVTGNELITNPIVAISYTAGAPTGQWKFDEASGGTAGDTSGYNKPGFISGGTAWVPGRTGSGLSFNGSTGLINIPDGDNPTDLTMSLWVKPATAGAQSIMTRTDDSGPGVSFSDQLRINAAGKFETYLYSLGSFGPSAGGKTVTGSTTVVPNTWYHVTLTRSFNGTLRLYVNGVQEGSPVAAGRVWMAGTRWVLASGTVGFPAFNGVADDVQVFNAVLSDAAIAALR